MSVNEVKLKSVDEDKLFVVKGTGPASNRTFAIGNEDHTLGNALRHVRIHVRLNCLIEWMHNKNVGTCSNIAKYIT